MEKKSVLVDLYALRNPYCGLGQVADNYLRQLCSYAESGRADKEGIEFTVLVPKGFVCKEPGYERLKQVKYHKIHKFLPRLLPKADLWHSTDQFFKAWRSDVPQLLTVHDLNFLKEKAPERAVQYLRKITRRVNRCTTLAVISHFVADDVSRHIDLRGRKPEVIYDGVEDLTAKPAERPAFVREGRPFFFTIGQVVKKKNFRSLVPLMKHFSGHDLYICGQPGTDVPEIESRVASMQLDNVFLPGPISNAEKIWMYRHCSAFLFPSLLEGFGLPVVEAMQFGIPVFTSNCSSIPEVAGGYSFIWDSFDPEAMVALMEKELPGFAERTDFIRDMKHYAVSRFTYERNFEEYLALYRKMLGLA